MGAFNVTMYRSTCSVPNQMHQLPLDAHRIKLSRPKPRSRNVCADLVVLSKVGVLCTKAEKQEKLQGTTTARCQ